MNAAVLQILLAGLLRLSTVGIVTKIQSKSLSHSIERTPIDAENFCGFDFISLGLLQYAGEMTLFDLLKRQGPFVAMADRSGSFLCR